jgi:hypothetical protein
MTRFCRFAFATLLTFAIAGVVYAAPPGTIIFDAGYPKAVAGGKIEAKGTLTIDNVNGWTVQSVTLYVIPTAGGERVIVDATPTLVGGIGRWDNGANPPQPIIATPSVAGPQNVYVEMKVTDNTKTKYIVSQIFVVNP